MTLSDKKILSCYRNHGRPMSRRDLFSQGAYAVGGYVVTPSLAAMLSSVARGQSGPALCPGEGSKTRMMPLIVLDLAGGGHIAGLHAVVGARGGQSDSLAPKSYETVGLTPGKAPGAPGVTLNSEFGLAFHPDSTMLAGMQSTTDAATRANVEGVLFCAKTGDDARTNPLNPLYWIVQSGAVGELVPLIGTNDGASGGNSTAPAKSIQAGIAPSRISKPDDALGLVDPGKLATLLSTLSGTAEGGKKDAEKVLKKIQSISETALKSFQAKPLPTQLSTLVNCGYLGATQYLNKFAPANLDPRNDSLMTQVFPGLAADPAQQSSATIAKLVLDGYAAGGTIVLGGYDYHGAGRDKQDAKDREVGELIGRLLQAASLKKTNLMVYVITDGGVSSAATGTPVNGFLPFTSDSGERSAAMALVYKAGQGRPEIRDNRRQIGAYNSTGAVDLSVAPKISGSAEGLTKALVANYLALHGREGELAKVVGDDPFGADLNEYLAFGKIV